MHFMARALLLAAGIMALSVACTRSGERRPRSAAMVVAGSFGDAGFFDGALDGLKRAAGEHRLAYSAVECGERLSRFETDLADAAAKADIVVVLGYQFYETVQALARNLPDVRFLYIDGGIDGIANLSSVDFREAEGAYLAGVLAASVTLSGDMPKANPLKRVGMVGGMDIPVIREFVEGFLAGVESVDPDIEAFVSFAGSFEDREAARKAAEAMYAAGADVVFQAAGGAGMGVFEAAKAADRYAIGVDQDQRHIDPERILASMVKDVGAAVRDLIGKTMDGTIEGGVRSYGLDGAFLGMDYGQDDPGIPAPILARVEAARAGIVSGTVRATGED